MKTIRELVYKRGYGKVNKQRIALSSNQIIEENLGKYGILCIEDIVNELASAGPKCVFDLEPTRSIFENVIDLSLSFYSFNSFKQVNNFLWPFKLSNPLGGSRPRKIKTFIEGGETGKREHFINELVRKSN